MRAAIYTLGCKVNQYESQAIEKLLREAGCELVDFSSEAEVYIVNTCSVTAEGDRKSRQIIRRARKNSPEALIAVCGCYSQTRKAEAEELGADVIFGTNDKAGFVKCIAIAAKNREKATKVDEAKERRGFEMLQAGGLSGRTRAMIKVQDGCANFCAYCIIPYARGPARSLPLDDALAEARRLNDEGYRELVITGIEISSYGRDLSDGSDLVLLCAAICAAVPDMRVRLGSLEPGTVTERFCSGLKEFPNLCGHFHLSLQSGSDAVLRRMGRKYDTERFYRSVELLREHFPGCAVTTDLIVGFPGETEEEFGETLAFINRCGFSSMHIFPYSKREGTKAAGMPDQVSKTVKERRAARAREAAMKMRAEYLSGCVGKTLPVLFENGGRGHAPNYMLVEAENAPSCGQIGNVCITSVEGDHLRGEVFT